MKFLITAIIFFTFCIGIYTLYIITVDVPKIEAKILFIGGIFGMVLFEWYCAKKDKGPVPWSYNKAWWHYNKCQVISKTSFTLLVMLFILYEDYLPK